MCAVGSYLPVTYLQAALAVLSRAEKESAVHQRIAVEDQHRRQTQHTGHARSVQCCQRGQDETTGVVVTMISFILHLQDRTDRIKRTPGAIVIATHTHTHHTSLWHP